MQQQINESETKESPWVRFDSEQEIDGSVWKVYSLSKNEGLVALTQVGKDIIKEKGSEIFEAINKYKKQYKSQERNEGRIFISKGTNGSVYSIGQDIAVKESVNGISLYETISRMDVLKWVMDHGNLPVWIKMPEHYGIVEFKRKDGINQNETLFSFMFMQQIDSGITVADVVDNAEGKSFDDTRKIIAKNLGEITKEESQTIELQFQEMLKIITQAIQNYKKINPKIGDKNLLPDFRRVNVLVERLVPPQEGKPFKLWLIDQ